MNGHGGAPWWATSSDQGFGLPPRRLDNVVNDSQSPLMSASFFARLHPLIFRSVAIASVIRSKYSDQTSSTGRRDDVYPSKVPA